MNLFAVDSRQMGMVMMCGWGVGWVGVCALFWPCWRMIQWRKYHLGLSAGDFLLITLKEREDLLWELVLDTCQGWRWGIWGSPALQNVLHLLVLPSVLLTRIIIFIIISFSQSSLTHSMEYTSGQTDCFTDSWPSASHFPLLLNPPSFFGILQPPHDCVVCSVFKMFCPSSPKYAEIFLKNAYFSPLSLSLLALNLLWKMPFVSYTSSILCPQSLLQTKSKYNFQTNYKRTLTFLFKT